MSRMHCTSCNDQIYDEDIRWAFDEPYCQPCFEDRFTYCSHCDDIISRSGAHYSEDSDPYCDQCWDEEFDDTSPQNPDVYDVDRKLIVELSRSWLLGKKSVSGILKINTNDESLSQLRDKVGLVDNPVYLYGLKDREEYQLTASMNLKDRVTGFILCQGLDWKITEGVGFDRLGISASLRRNHQRTLVKLIKSLTTAQITVRTAS